MKSYISITQLVRSQIEQYQRVAWFLIEWVEREQRVALRSLAAWTAPIRAYESPPRGNDVTLKRLDRTG